MIKLFIMPISASQEDPTIMTIQFPFNNFDFTFKTLHDTYTCTLFNVNILDNFNQFHFSFSRAIKPLIFSNKPSLTLIMFSCCRWTSILAIFQRHVKKDGKRCKDSKFWLAIEHPRRGQERSASVLNLLRRQKWSVTSLPLDVHLLMVRTQQDSNPKPSDLEPCTLLNIPWQAEQLYVWFRICQLLLPYRSEQRPRYWFLHFPYVIVPYQMFSCYVYMLLICRRYSWWMQLAKQEIWIAHNSSLVSSYSIDFAIATMHQFLYILVFGIWTLEFMIFTQITFTYFLQAR